MKRTRFAVAVALVALLAFASSAAAAVIHVPADYSTISAAISAAAAGDTIAIADGTYSITSTLNVTKSLTISGNSESGVVLQINCGSGYGFNVAADDVILENMTLDIVTAGADTGYPIHASGTPNPPDGYDNLTIQHLTVKGDLTTTPKRRTGVDVHGYNNVSLSYITSSDASFGNGLQVTGCVGVTMDHITTANNAWGSIAIYCSKPTYLNRGSSNVTIDGSTLNLGEDNIFQQDEFGLVSTNVSVTGYQHHVYNDTFRAEAPGYTFFKNTEADAIAAALAFTGYESGSSIERIADGHYIVANGMSIQTAVDDAPAGGVVEVRAGTYTEQVEIAKDLTLQGAGAGSSFINAFDSMPLSFTTAAANFPIVYIHDADAVYVRDFTVDGLGLGNTNYRFLGVAWHEAGGGLYDCEIKDVRNTPLNGAQHGVGVYSYNDDGVTRTIDVQGCTIYGFQKNGVTLAASGTTPLVVDVSGNTITGSTGLTYDNGDPAQNGIELYGDLITGSVANNTVYSIAYDNTNASTKWVATSILDIFSEADITDNVIGNHAHMGVYKWDGSGLIANNDITIEKIGVYAFGIIGTDPPEVKPSPFNEVTELPTPGAASKAAMITVQADDNTLSFTGTDNSATYAIEADAGWGPDDVSFSASGNTITGFEVGMALFMCESGCDTGVFTNLSVTGNSFSGNTYGIYSNVSYLTADGTCNWWGDVTGPAPVGVGDAVSGDVTFYPWLTGDITGTPTCDGMPNVIAAVPPTGVEITPCNSCVTVPVTITRADTTPIRGISVTFELSSELALCGGNIVPTYGTGSWVDGFNSGDVQDFILDNGDGTWTVDRSLLGSACGSTIDGSVFTVDVASTLGSGSGVGTITVLSVTLRDCNNAPVSGLAGGAATIDIDATAPDTVTNLAASQVKSGNDTDGTTKIHLSWTAPTDPDAATVTLYRKGFGFYPEYDDLGGSVPATPADPAAALAAGWAVAGTVPATATSYDDEPATRDFWYYVAFVDDGCNVSAVSNQTGGTLNYHLGDVSDGVTAGAGNNAVGTEDISALGTGYGSVEGDASYQNFLDVGPTTDYSVDALPTTDNAVQFEDLMMFAINYGQVSKGAPALKPAAANEITLNVVPRSDELVTVEIHMAGDGTIQGVHVPLRWNETALRPVAMHEGSLMAKQNRTTMVLSARAGEVDAAVFGQGSGISGEGLLATIDFQVVGEGEFDIAPGEIVARDGKNHETSINGSVVSGETPQALPSRTVLHPNYPNPFNPRTTLSFTLAKAGHVTLRVYSLDGRQVTTLVDEDMTAGPHSLQWAGLDDQGRTVSSGAYLVRLVAPDVSASERITLLK